MISSRLIYKTAKKIIANAGDENANVQDETGSKGTAITRYSNRTENKGKKSHKKRV
jgi:hypothetical protein